MRKIYFMVNPSLKNVIDALPETLERQYITIGRRCFTNEERERLIPVSRNYNQTRLISMAIGKKVTEVTDEEFNEIKFRTGDVIYVAIISEEMPVDAQTVRDSIYKIDFMCL